MQMSNSETKHDRGRTVITPVFGLTNFPLVPKSTVGMASNSEGDEEVLGRALALRRICPWIFSGGQNDCRPRSAGGCGE